MSYNLSDYDFDFPQELIAQKTAGKGETKILHCPKNGSPLQILKSSQITDLFKPQDCIVVNNTQVIPARLLGKTKHGGKAEILLLKQLEAAEDGSARWQAWVKPGKAFENDKEVFISKIKCKCSGFANTGGSKIRIINFSIPNAEFNSFLAANGHVPLPPYINRSDSESDKSDYQTIFARHAGAVAAPTASLHFSESMANKLKAKGVFFAETTLHIGPGTFENIKESEDFRKHKMHSEEYELNEDNANIINKCKKNGGRIICIGTTSMRVLETLACDNGCVHAGKGITDIFIYPGFKFKTADALLTNFHWPKSSLILLVAAFYGRENTLNAYKYAVQNQMKLFSYGDGMLILQ
ncbi:MAG: tRNA preQ1(34) S-adenosylmethionine ribosyltransferase-isomerase QueA [Fibromonadaceae bacterium]|jgi:S-adenosylmethionine:tRNA ribosyltransferase-isomerase|nr:tRNA preQ1(34) S-adenosylmethionine ribosyltransferase-isomerase QueA [Fibromonadaceae bacterium]